MRNVLIIAYYFPPLGGSGVIRPVKFAKYLPQFGWLPTILTVTQGDSFYIDDHLLHEIPDQVKIARAASVDLIKTTKAKSFSDQLKSTSKMTKGRTALKKHLAKFLRTVYFSVFIPDDKIGWIRPAVNKGLQLSKMHKFEAIFATAPPQSNLLVAMRLKERLKIPVVIDYRDEWTTNPHKAMPNPLTLWLNRRLERRTLNKADALTVVSAGMIDNLQRNQIISNNQLQCAVIPNGFDPADFEISSTSKNVSPNQLFNIVYTGSFYGEYRVPDPLLYALATWLEKEPGIRKNIKMSFYGSIFPHHQALIDKLHLRDITCVTGVVSNQEAITAQKKATILALIIGTGEGPAVLTGKIFEYLGAQKPILAMVPPQGEAAALIRKTKTGTVVSPDNIDAIVNALQNYYIQWQTSITVDYTPDQVEVRSYSRPEQARQLADLLKQLTVVSI